MTTARNGARGTICRRLVLTLGLFAALAAAAESPQAEVLISARELAGRLAEPGLVVVDVRAAERYSAGHLPTALRLPSPSSLMSLDPPEIEARLGDLGLDGSETVVLYGEADGEAEVGAAFFVLESAGVDQVRVLDGGVAAWTDLGMRLEGGAEHLPPKVFAPSQARRTSAEADAMLSSLGAADSAIIDVRAGRGWALYQPTAEFSSGHVPTALLYDFSTLWGGEGGGSGIHRDARDELARLGPRAGTGVDLGGRFVVYGEDAGDSRTALAYMTLRALGLDVQVYRPGWSGWTSDGARPVVKIVEPQELEALEERRETADGTPFFVRLPIFDLREMRDWEVGHVPGAYPLTPGEFPRFFQMVLQRYWPEADPSRDPLVVYCYGPDCTRSRQGIVVAAGAGWHTIYWFRGGIASWFEAGFPLERLTPDETPWGQETGG